MDEFIQLLKRKGVLNMPKNIMLLLSIIAALAISTSSFANEKEASDAFKNGSDTISGSDIIQSTYSQHLTFEQRVACQKAIEQVYWNHRIWPQENPQPKPSLESIISDEAIRIKAEDVLRKSHALDYYWKRPITPEQLQQEMNRMALHTRKPGILKELLNALQDDPFMIAECLARPVLADRLLRNWYAFDERFHGIVRQQAEKDIENYKDLSRLKLMSGHYKETEWIKLSDNINTKPMHINNGTHQIILNEEDWLILLQKLEEDFTINDKRKDSRPITRYVIINAPQILASGKISLLKEDANRFYVIAIISNEKNRIKAAVVEWRKRPFEEWMHRLPKAFNNEIPDYIYAYRKPVIADNICDNDTWTPTFVGGAPSERYWHTAVWTGMEMIIWGGWTNTGGIYNPSTDTWVETSLVNVPLARFNHTAVWSGTEMIVWGGDDTNSSLNTGGRYNPDTDSWIATNTINAPEARFWHTAIWTGSEMII